jgi:hypothetical protein
MEQKRGSRAVAKARSTLCLSPTGCCSTSIRICGVAGCCGAATDQRTLLEATGRGSHWRVAAAAALPLWGLCGTLWE